MTSTVKKTIGRDLPNGDYIEIEAEERGAEGTLSPGFAITLLGWEARGEHGRRGRAVKAGGGEATFAGADHETILAAAPELAPIVTVHLADPDGTPMHAVDNGWYFYSGKASAYEREHYSEEYATRYGTDHERAADALHVDPADLPTDLDHDGFLAYAATLTERWAAQAQAARDALAAMVDGDGVEG
jgi:hypothetical protein